MIFSRKASGTWWREWGSQIVYGTDNPFNWP